MIPEIEFKVDGLPWLILPTRFPSADFASATAAAGHALAIFAQREGGESVKTSWGMKLSSYLENAARGQYSGLFLWLTEPLLPHAIVTAELYPVQGEAEETLPLLGGAPRGEPFPVPGLGDGARYESTAQVRKGLFGKASRKTVRWVWRIDEVDLVVTLERDDDESLARMLPDVEALLAAVVVTSE